METQSPPQDGKECGVSEEDRIIAKLSDRQQEALLKQQGSVGVCRALKAKGLSWKTEGTGMAWEAYPVLSHMGDRVRLRLLDLRLSAPLLNTSKDKAA